MNNQLIVEPKKKEIRKMKIIFLNQDIVLSTTIYQIMSSFKTHISQVKKFNILKNSLNFLRKNAQILVTDLQDMQQLFSQEIQSRCMKEN